LILAYILGVALFLELVINVLPKGGVLFSRRILGNVCNYVHVKKEGAGISNPLLD
tara:strand:+ start:23 stop:187 length:165 start_codon:yes stop_codon:yes gene_type:complete